MFEETRNLSHEEVLTQLRKVVEQIDPADVANAFFYSLSTRALEYRSAIETDGKSAEEKQAREKEHDIEFVSKAFPQTVFKEFKGLAHAELVMMFPERFAAEVKRFLEE